MSNTSKQVYGRRVFQTLITLTFTAAFAQGMLAGKFIAGNYDALRLHGINTAVLGVLSSVLLAAALVDRWLLRGSWRPSVAAFLVLILGHGQALLGESDVLSVHVPLGVAIVVILAIFTRWAWTTPISVVLNAEGRAS